VRIKGGERRKKKRSENNFYCFDYLRIGVVKGGGKKNTDVVGAGTSVERKL